MLSLPSRSALTRTLNRSKETTSLPTIARDDRHFENVHIQIGGFHPPCVYALLSNKRLSIYNKFLTALKSLIDDVTQERIFIDFEIAALSTFNSHYETDIQGCYFHLCQSFMRKISELGLKKTYESNSELVLALNMIPALSFTSLLFLLSPPLPLILHISHSFATILRPSLTTSSAHYSQLS